MTYDMLCSSSSLDPKIWNLLIFLIDLELLLKHIQTKTFENIEKNKEFSLVWKP